MNRLISGLALLALLWVDVAVAQYQAAVLADNPIAYYRFEETSGTTAADTSGNGNTGTFVNGPLLGQPSAAGLGRAARFDGINDHVLTSRTVGGNFTLEMWVNTASTSLSGSQAFEGNGLIWSDVGGAANDFVLAFLNNRASFFTGNPDVSIIGTTAINTGGWHHIVATRAQGGATQLYVNGALQATGTTNGSVLDANPQIAIGGNVLDSRYFDGLIDEVAYYPSVLPANRVAAHFGAGAISPSVPASSTWSLAALTGALILAGFLGLRWRRARAPSAN